MTDRSAYNDAHRIILDDGSSTNYTTTANTGLAVPVDDDAPTCRGSARPSPSRPPVILIKDFNAWRLLPTSQVVGAPSGTQPQLQQTRAAIAAAGERRR